jgi:hypothetical protein
MSKKRELLALALIALEDAHLHIDKFQDEDTRLSVIEQIKELLAQPEQEPVGWWDEKLGFFKEKHFDQLQPLYLAPPKREPLGDAEVLKIAIKIAGDVGIEHDPTDFEGTGVFELARAIEKAHGIGVTNE